MAVTSFPLTPLEKLCVTIDRSMIEAAYLPFLLDGEAGARAWEKDFARRRRGTLKRLVKRVLGLKQRDSKAIRAEYHDAWSVGFGKYDVAAGPNKPAAWLWNERKLALDGIAAARLRAPLLAAVIAELKPKRVLEVGCGNGINLLSLAGQFPDVEFTGIDLTPAGIEAAHKVQAEAALPPSLAEYIPLERKDAHAFKRIRLMVGSAAELPFADGEFDLVYTVLAVEQMERIRHAALGEIARVSGGHVLMLEPFRDANSRGARRLYALSRNYFRGSIAELTQYGLEPVWATVDFPQEAFLGSPLVLARKAGPAA
jgi:ubiquinone/menaquinone biosynthesis C-methylase UbiE